MNTGASIRFSDGGGGGQEKEEEGGGKKKKKKKKKNRRAPRAKSQYKTLHAERAAKLKIVYV